MLLKLLISLYSVDLLLLILSVKFCNQVIFYFFFPDQFPLLRVCDHACVCVRAYVRGVYLYVCGGEGSSWRQLGGGAETEVEGWQWGGGGGGGENPPPPPNRLTSIVNRS